MSLIRYIPLKNKDYKPFDENVFTQLVSDNEVEHLAKESELSNWFFDKMKDYRLEK